MPSLGTSFSILLLLVCTPTAFGLISAPSLPSRGSRPFASVSSKHGLLPRGALSSPRARGARQRAALLRSHAIRRSSAVVATSREGRRPPRSGREVLHRRWALVRRQVCCQTTRPSHSHGKFVGSKPKARMVPDQPLAVDALRSSEA